MPRAQGGCGAAWHFPERLRLGRDASRAAPGGAWGRGRPLNPPNHPSVRKPEQIDPSCNSAFRHRFHLRSQSSLVQSSSSRIWVHTATCCVFFGSNGAREGSYELGSGMGFSLPCASAMAERACHGSSRLAPRAAARLSTWAARLRTRRALLVGGRRRPSTERRRADAARAAAEHRSDRLISHR